MSDENMKLFFINLTVRVFSYPNEPYLSINRTRATMCDNIY